MERIQAMKVNFYTTDGSELEDRMHTCEEDSIEGLQTLMSEIVDIPNVSEDILSFEFDLHIATKEDVDNAKMLLQLTQQILPNK